MQKLGTKFMTRDDEKCSGCPNFSFSLVVFDGLGLVRVFLTLVRGVMVF
jgi:hypothetical protein